MKISFVNQPSKTALVIYPIFEKEKSGNKLLDSLIQKLRQTKEFEAKESEVYYHYNDKKSIPPRLLLLGLGKAKKLTVTSVMNAFGAAVRTSHHHKSKRLAIWMESELFPFAQIISEAIAMANYQPAAPYKTGKSLKKLHEQRTEMLEVVGVSKNKSIRHAWTKGLTLSSTVNELRDWVNAPPNIANAKFFQKRAQEIAQATHAKLTILRKKELEKLNMGALLGVNRGSPDEAQIIILDYTPVGDKKEPPIIFVGKGIIFDSGGYNLKPRGYIEDMHLDKAGGATVIALIKILHELGIQRRVIAVAPFTENLIGPEAVKPSEILKTYSGKTIEITNTDGEGRLILCDAISYAIDQFKPQYLIDVATLTGACMVALGDRYAGLFSNNRELMEQLRTAGEEVDELLWPMPIHKDFSEKMQGQYADLRNADLGSEVYAGASKGAAFLQEFVGKTKWAHLDIAGPAFTKDPKKYEHKGATGFGLRVLVKFLGNLK